jgi:quercetin dioxygenase-like cupin family protein
MRQNLRLLLAMTALATFSLAAGAMASEAGSAAKIVTPESLSFAPAQGLPAGAEIAVLYGDPTKEGPFTARFRFPAGYTIATHSHPTDEFLTVISGKARMAFGEDAEEGKAQPLGPGSFMSLPAGAWHSLWIDADTVIELHSTGPFGVKSHMN